MKIFALMCVECSMRKGNDEIWHEKVIEKKVRGYEFFF